MARGCEARGGAGPHSPPAGATGAPEVRRQTCRSATHIFSMNSTRSAPRIMTPSMCETSKMPTASLRHGARRSG